MLDNNLKGWIIYIVLLIVLIYFGLNNYQFIRYNFFILSLIIFCMIMTVLFWFFYRSKSED